MAFHLRVLCQFRVLRSSTAVALAGLAVLGAGEAWSQAGPFSALHGSWSGGGTIKKSNGGSERIRCRSAYEPSGGANLTLHMRCASDSYNIDLSANLAYQGGAISGSWQEATRRISGDVSGRVSNEGRQVQAVVSAPGVTSNITLTTRGSRQAVSILTPGTDVPEVSVNMEKR